jgi:hypothetical protein
MGSAEIGAQCSTHDYLARTKSQNGSVTKGFLLRVTYHTKT